LKLRELRRYKGALSQQPRGGARPDPRGEAPHPCDGVLGSNHAANDLDEDRRPGGSSEHTRLALQAPWRLPLEHETSRFALQDTPEDPFGVRPEGRPELILSKVPSGHEGRPGVTTKDRERRCEAADRLAWQVTARG
jgi:hypothetical protein